MRSEKEMFDLIMEIAEKDDRILAVYMNGSRTNKNVPKDIFQDYDVVYVATETKGFYEDPLWIQGFGNALYMQKPDEMDYLRGRTYCFDDCYGWLIQFDDGNRLDLHVVSIPYACRTIDEDKLCVVLMDKQKILPRISEATDEDYHVKKPVLNDYLCDCNNFWWCLNNVAKGLWREEVPYVMDMINEHIRPHLVNMLSWKIGIETGFSCSVGKSGKYMKNYLTKEIWNRFLGTYSDADIEHIWEAVWMMCDLFEEVAKEVGQILDYPYCQEEATGSMVFLEKVKHLPKDAKEIF